MKNNLIIALICIATIFTFSNCTRIESGHVGVKVNMYGTGKGVDDITECTGVVVFNPLTTKIYEFPISVRHTEYKDEHSFVVNSKDGSEFRVSPILNYLVQRDKVPTIFAKYRKDLESIESGFLKTTIYDAFRMEANTYTAEELISNRQNFENKVRAKLDSNLLREGFIVQQLTSNLGYPETFKRAIEAKNNAVQQSLTAENQVKTAEANAKIKVAKAQGDAEALLTNARAEAEANRLKQATITPMLLELEKINKWDGKLPQTVITGKDGGNVLLNLAK
jgi:regulator of protease activity HflC (stomatin/prohibitin superfamily)